MNDQYIELTDRTMIDRCQSRPFATAGAAATDAVRDNAAYVSDDTDDVTVTERARRLAETSFDRLLSQGSIKQVQRSNVSFDIFTEVRVVKLL